MAITRRSFLAGSAAGLAGLALARDLGAAEAAPAPPRLRIGARHFGYDLERAKRAGMDGVELCEGRAADRLHVADPAVREKAKAQMKTTGVAVSSVCIDFLNGNPVATDERGVAWLLQAIEAAGDLGAAAILVPFFGGASSLVANRQLKREAVDALVPRLKEVAAKAKEAKVVLGLENTCSAEQNLEILDRVASDAVGVYYDIGNSTGAGYDVPVEIRALKGRIAMFHFKDGNAYLGEGRVRMEPVAEAIKAIEYLGWIVLETGNPSKDPVADCKRNGDYIRKLLGIAG
jgi:sugar phosphate isomerase/epimerase